MLLKIATRMSQLALWQANYVKARLEAIHSDLKVELVPMKTQGDKIIDTPLTKIGGKGLFTKELEHALLEGRADIAVHSMKDVTVDMPEGLVLPVICERASPFDAWVSNQFSSINDCPEGAVVGTSSLRRSTQLKILRPDLTINNLRGNVPTRLKKLDDGHYDAIILACAGLDRLELSNRITESISDKAMLPAVGQGAVGIQCRDNDNDVLKQITPLNDSRTQLCVTAERAMNKSLGGSCHVPIAGYAIISGDEIFLRGYVSSPDASQVVRSEARQSLNTETSLAICEKLGHQVAEALFAQGAEKLL